MDLRECYAILDLPYGASAEEVQRAYRTMVQVWHPDRFAHNAELQRKATEKLSRINAAYEAINSGTAAAADATPVYIDRECTYKGSDPRLPMVGYLKALKAVVELSDDVALVLHNGRELLAAMLYPCRSVQAIVTGDSVFVRPNGRMPQYTAVWNTVVFFADDPEGVLPAIPVVLDFQNEYRAKVFAKRLQTAAGLTPYAPPPPPPKPRPAPAPPPPTKPPAAPKSPEVERTGPSLVWMNLCLLPVTIALAVIVARSWPESAVPEKRVEKRIETYRPTTPPTRQADTQHFEQPKPAEPTHPVIPEFVCLRSTKARVLELCGEPLHRTTRRGGETWDYDRAGKISFDHSDRVTGWQTLPGAIPVRIIGSRGHPIERTTGATFTRGSKRSEVAAAQGTPTFVFGDTWGYSTAVDGPWDFVNFERDRVVTWENPNGTLNLTPGSKP